MFTMTGHDLRNTEKINAAVISKIYPEIRPRVLNYVKKHIGNIADAEDIAQDIFLRLLETRSMIVAHNVHKLVYNVAHHLVIDWYRRHALSAKAQEYFSLHSAKSADLTEEAVCFNEIKTLEKKCMDRMNARKRNIYIMYMHQGLSSGEISEMLSISKRTVENHLFSARHFTRNELMKAL